MSAIGTSQTLMRTLTVSALEGEADIPDLHPSSPPMTQSGNCKVKTWRSHNVERPAFQRFSDVEILVVTYQ